MASAKTLNAKNLEALGAERLAALLIEISAADATAKRRLRLELAGTAGAGEVAREVAKRLASIAKARSFVDWHKIKPLAVDLEAQHHAIMTHVAPADPREAHELLWRLMACAEPVFARSDDSNGRLGGVFHVALLDLQPLAKAAAIAPAALADRVFEAARNNGYGQFDDLVTVLAPALGPAGLVHLRERVLAWLAEPRPVLPEADRRVIGWGTGGPLYEDQIEPNSRNWTITSLLRQIADALGDLDGYIAQFDDRARRVPAIAAEIATRLLDAGRLEEAWAAIEAGNGARALIPGEWEQARIAILEAMGRGEDAQAFRWERFLATLSIAHLRAYLHKLPDFEDFEAEQAAIGHVAAYPSVHAALDFLVNWPALDRAAGLVMDRSAELDGNFYERLSPAAEVVEEGHPLAATLLLRKMIDFTLDKARTTRYRHAARHLSHCAALARRIADWRDVPDHAAYERKLRDVHGRKRGFWDGAEAI
jgi:hypothetical protein